VKSTARDLASDCSRHVWTLRADTLLTRRPEFIRRRPRTESPICAHARVHRGRAEDQMPSLPKTDQARRNGVPPLRSKHRRNRQVNGHLRLLVNRLALIPVVASLLIATVGCGGARVTTHGAVWEQQRQESQRLRNRRGISSFCAGSRPRRLCARCVQGLSRPLAPTRQMQL
jgi:hypothetical protein